jgi:membrane fusion protein (multidrug efflux system)
MQNQSVTGEELVIGTRSYSIRKLTEFGFNVSGSLSAEELGSTNKNSAVEGELTIGGQRLPVLFRVRGHRDGVTVCSFANLTLTNKETIRRYLANRDRHGSNAELENRTYDELAKGVVASDSAPSTTAAVAAPPQQKGYVKTFALMALLFTMLGLLVLAAVFLKSRSSLSVGNSALVGNYLPINTKVEGVIVDVFVNEGDTVKAGDLLLRINNPDMTAESERNAATLITAQAKVRALQTQLKGFETKLGIATKKLALDLEVAESELDAAEKMRASVRSAVARMTPYVASGSVTQLELDEINNQLMAAEAECIAAKNLARQIKFSQEAADSNVLILSDRLDDELGRLKAELEVAEAEAEEIRRVGEVLADRVSELDIVAPRDGRVFVTYRQVGEYLRVADEVIALSYPGKTWAAGQLTTSQASRVRPGQPVTVSVPSLDMKLEGFVSAVGHRAMYSHGRYTADFRGATATDVPVKVVIDDIPSEIPSGIRLEMAINTGFGIKWLDDSMGYELKPIGNDNATSSLVASKEANPSKDATLDTTATALAADQSTASMVDVSQTDDSPISN